MSAAFSIILHHFDQSPFSEKVRIVFGLKKIAWTSVRISRIMPSGFNAADGRLSADAG